MNLTTLTTYTRIRGFSQSELARRSGISRQVVSQWFQRAAGVPDSIANVYSKNQEAVARSLGLKASDLSERLPVLSDPTERRRVETSLLWDHLFPDLETYVSALIRRDLSAMARLVQVYGLYAAEKILGRVIIKRFPVYKSKIHPAARRNLEILWTHLQE